MASPVPLLETERFEMDEKQLPLLSLEHARKSFGETEVLKDI